jgi:hypothetical protein
MTGVVGRERFSGKVRLELELVNAGKLLIAGNGLTVTVANEGRYIEDFNPGPSATNPPTK